MYRCFVESVERAAAAEDLTLLPAVQDTAASLTEHAAILQKRIQHSIDAPLARVPSATHHLSGMWDLMPQTKEPYGTLTPNIATLHELKGYVNS